MRRPCLRGRAEPQARQARVPFNDFQFFFQKRADLPSMALMEGIESRRILDDLFEAPQRGCGAVAANQQRDLADVGNVFEQIDKPDLADESRYADEKQMPIRQVLTHRETIDSRRLSEERHRLAGGE